MRVSTPGARCRFHRALDRYQLTGEFPQRGPDGDAPDHVRGVVNFHVDPAGRHDDARWRSTAATTDLVAQQGGAEEGRRGVAARESCWSGAPQVQRARPLVDGAGAVETAT